MYNLEDILKEYNNDLTLDIIYLDSYCSATVFYKGYTIGKLSNTSDIGFMYKSSLSDCIIYDVKDSMHPLKCNVRKPGTFIKDMLKLIGSEMKIIDTFVQVLGNKESFIKELIALVNKYQLMVHTDGVDGSFQVNILESSDLLKLKALL